MVQREIHVLGAQDLDLSVTNSGADESGWTVGNPCAVIERTSDVIVLLATANRACDSEAAVLSRAGLDSRRCFLATSSDFGLTWTRGYEVTERVKQADWTWYATGPGGAIQLADGRLVFPCNHAQTTEDGFVRRRSHVLLADPPAVSLRAAQGDTAAQLNLRIGGLCAPFTNECAVVELPGGDLLLNARDFSGRCIRWQARSYDSGVSWTPGSHVPTLCEPAMYGCHAGIVACGTDGSLAFANPASTRRERLGLRFSVDAGSTWTDPPLIVHEGPSAYCSLQTLQSNGERHGEAAAAEEASIDGGPVVGILCECGDHSPYERIVFTMATPSGVVGAPLPSAINISVGGTSAAQPGAAGLGKIRPEDDRMAQEKVNGTRGAHAPGAGADGMFGAWG